MPLGRKDARSPDLCESGWPAKRPARVEEWPAARFLSCAVANRPGRGLVGAHGARSVRLRLLNLLIDAPSSVALDVQATPARSASEVDAGRDMLVRVAQRFDCLPKRVAADTAYGNAAFLAFVRVHGTVPHVPVLERSKQTKGKFSRQALTFDREHDRYVCPSGKVLACVGTREREGVRTFRARPSDCGACPVRERCTVGRCRVVTHLEDEDTRDQVRAEMRTGLLKRSMRLRREIERLSADAKSRRGLGRLRLRGLRGA